MQEKNLQSVISCSSPYSQGGIGQHFAQIVEGERKEETLVRYYATGIRPGDDLIGRRVSLDGANWLWRYTPARWSPGWTSYLNAEAFDYKVAAHLDEPLGRFVAFVGKALRSFRRAREVGFERLELVAANSHVNNLKLLHERAAQQTGIDDTWLNEAQRRKTLKEYEMADIIHVHSEYVRQSFLAEGISADKLKRMVLKVNPRFVPPTERPKDGIFRVVYVGRVDATKGIPLLIEAFSQIEDPAELIIVGGWSTRTMRKYMQQQLQRDLRIRMAPGDPLPVLQKADVFVHPTYEDGFGYAPVEALACGVPVIVTEDTGMKEYIVEGENGYVVPTGSREALLDQMEHVRYHPMAHTRSDFQRQYPHGQRIACGERSPTNSIR